MEHLAPAAAGPADLRAAAGRERWVPGRWEARSWEVPAEEVAEAGTAGEGGQSVRQLSGVAAAMGAP